MNVAMVCYLLGWILLCEGALLLLPLAVGMIYVETAARSLFVTILLCVALGGLLVLRKPKNRVLYVRESFVITALSWIVISVMGALPFLFAGAITDPISALFETVSGFTTTGASILTDVEALPHCLLFWRSFTHWIGGMGVLVFLLTLLPLAGGGGSHMNLMKAESPGPQVEKLVPKVQATAKILYGIYLALTLAEIAILLLSGMHWFDAMTLSFGTAGTGGFGVLNSSIGSYTLFQQGVITVFMILFGINFNFYFFLLLRKFRRAAAMQEVRCYLGIIAAAVLLITLNIRTMFDSVLLAFHHAAFQVGSIITTTGFSTVDFDLWPNFSKTILVMLMFVGACAGSTGGGIKVSRIIILFKTGSLEFKRFLHPQGVRKLTMDGKVVPDATVRSVSVFFGVYMLLFAGSLLLVSIENFDLITNFTAVAATLNNIGPGLAAVGPTQNFSLYSGFSKLVLTFDMLAGRLELFPLLLLFNRDTWRRF